MAARPSPKLLLCRAALAALLLSACREDPAPEQQAAETETREVRFVPMAVAVGQKEAVERRQSLRVAVEFWDDNERYASKEQSRAEHLQYRTEVLKRLGRTPGKIRVHYDRYHVNEAEWDKPALPPAVLAGNTYVLDATGSELVVTDAEGEQVLDERAIVLQSRHALLGKQHPVVAALAVRPLQVGKEYRMSSKMFGGLMGSQAGEYQGGKFTVREVEEVDGREVATLAWSARVQAKEGMMVSDWNVEGTARVSVRPAAVERLESKGVVEVSGSTLQHGKKLKIQGEGALEDFMEVVPVQ